MFHYYMWTLICQLQWIIKYWIIITFVVIELLYVNKLYYNNITLGKQYFSTCSTRLKCKKYIKEYASVSNKPLINI